MQFENEREMTEWINRNPDDMDDKEVYLKYRSLDRSKKVVVKTPKNDILIQNGEVVRYPVGTFDDNGNLAPTANRNSVSEVWQNSKKLTFCPLANRKTRREALRSLRRHAARS